VDEKKDYSNLDKPKGGHIKPIKAIIEEPTEVVTEEVASPWMQLKARKWQVNFNKAVGTILSHMMGPEQGELLDRAITLKTSEICKMVGKRPNVNG